MGRAIDETCLLMSSRLLNLRGARVKVKTNCYARPRRCDSMWNEREGAGVFENALSTWPMCISWKLTELSVLRNNMAPLSAVALMGFWCSGALALILRP